MFIFKCNPEINSERKGFVKQNKNNETNSPSKINVNFGCNSNVAPFKIQQNTTTTTNVRQKSNNRQRTRQQYDMNSIRMILGLLLV